MKRCGNTSSRTKPTPRNLHPARTLANLNKVQVTQWLEIASYTMPVLDSKVTLSKELPDESSGQPFLTIHLIQFRGDSQAKWYCSGKSAEKKEGEESNNWSFERS